MAKRNYAIGTATTCVNRTSFANIQKVGGKTVTANLTEQDWPAFGPVQGLKVLDVGTLLAGPFGASLLADFGAEVIKVEQPGVGDPIRQYGLPGDSSDSLAWINEARNKRVITLDLKQERGQEIFKQLVARSDILIENFSPGTFERWNLGWEQLHAVNPRLIMVRVSGFGQTGPYRYKPGLDRIALAFSGFNYVTGYPDRPPVRSTIAIADYLTGTFAALAAMMAVYERDVVGSGKGQMIDLALYEPPFRITEDMVATYARHGVIRQRTGNRNPNSAPAETFAAADGKWVIFHAGFDRLFQRLAQAMGRPDLIDDPRFRTMRDRVTNAEALYDIIAQWMATLPADEIIKTLEDAGVPAGQVYSVADIFEDPHFRARENLLEIEDEHSGRVTLPGIVPKFSRTPGQVVRVGQPLGADNDYVYLKLLKMDPEEYGQLKEQGVI